MRNHIAIKFIAVALAALALFAAVSSAAGVICLTALDLYDRSVEEYHEETAAGIRREFAVNLAHRYASLKLGGLPEEFLDSYFGYRWYYDTFTYDSFFYTIRNERGEAVETTVDQVMTGAKYYKIGVTDISYRKVVHDLPQGGIVSEGTEDISEPMTGNTETAPETTVPEVSDPEGDAVAEEAGDADQPDPASLMLDREETVHSDWYYDYEKDEAVELRWQYAQLPPYTVELYLMPGAMPDEAIWDMLQMLWDVRNYLFFVLGAGLLALAISMVYLCCAAGRRPGQEEVRASGLNRVPLDLYFVTVAGGVILGAAICMEFGWYLLADYPQVLIPSLGIAGYLCAVLIVGFFFALAAQFKTPGGFWWRGSLTARCLRLAWWCLKKCWQGLRWLLKHIPRSIKKAFSTLWRMLGNVCQWIGSQLARLYGLLPLTWQWLLAGALLLLILGLGAIARSVPVLLLGILVGIILVVYGAHAFGTLLEGVKRMSKGNLDSKVSDKALMGAFKDFAGDLNALSDVAVVAAQNQMKAERMKTELITNVSHDIKTPLTSIINFVDLMEKPHTPQEQEQYLEVLSRQSQRLKKLIDDLMEMSKASTGNVAVEITQVNAAEAINQALGEFGDKLERAELTPVFRGPEEPVTMLADGRLFWRVMSNVLSNAVKYAMPGTRLYIDLAELEERVVISLKNISRDPLNVTAEELLERFVRGDASRNTEGSGLGLNIAKSLMEVQKGQLTLLVDGDLFKVTLIFPKS